MSKFIRFFLPVSLITLGACVERNGAMNASPVNTVRDLDLHNGAQIVAQGEAWNAKLNPVLVRDDFVLQVPGIDTWPEGVHGKTIKLTGILEREELPDMRYTESGLIRAASAGGTRWIVRNPSWHVIEK